MAHKNPPPTDKRKSRSPGLPYGDEFLPADRCLEIHRHMVRARALEERMIKMSKSGEGYFWIGGPGEEAFNVCLGLQVRKGRGPAYDYLHLHYRNGPTMVAMGMPLADSLRQMAMTATDPHSRGRNFPGHFSVRDWNVVPVSSVIEIQYAMAPGTAIMQKRHGGEGVTVVVGGEAGTSEGDFASCMIWSSRPANPVPVLMVVMNNRFGISTPYDQQHAEKHVVDRGRPFGIPGEVVDGNDPLASWFALEKAFRWCRTERKPYMLEALVSRLYGHSSSSGAPRSDDPDCIVGYEERLLEGKLVSREQLELIHQQAQEEVEAALQQVLKEQRPLPGDELMYTYAPSPVDRVYPKDYTGLPDAHGEGGR